MAVRGARHGIASIFTALLIGVLGTAFWLSADAAPPSDTPPDPSGAPSVYRSNAWNAYNEVKIGWLPDPATLTAAEQAPEATVLAVINQRMAEVAAEWARKHVNIDPTVTPDRLDVKMAGLLPGNRRVFCAKISPGNHMYSDVIMSVDRDAPLVDPREVWDEDGNRPKGEFAGFVTDTLRVNTWESDTFTGVELRMCGAG
jgi:hypothetical protein